MSNTSIVIDGLLKPDGSLELDSSPTLPPGRVRVTLQSLPAVHDDDDLDWADLDYDPVPLKRRGQVTVRVKPRGKLKPMLSREEDKY